MGEIGISHDRFLYGLKWWEINSIIRGYRRRDRLKHQLMAECAYAAIYAMRDPKGKTVVDMFPQLFKDDEDNNDEPRISDEEAAELQEEMDAINAAVNP